MFSAFSYCFRRQPAPCQPAEGCAISPPIASRHFRRLSVSFDFFCFRHFAFQLPRRLILRFAAIIY